MSPCHGFGLLHRGRRPVGGLPQAELSQQRLKALPVLCQVDDDGRRAEDRDAGLFQSGGELERGLAAKLDNGSPQPAAGPSFAHLDNVLRGEGLEVQAVGCVVVGGDGFRVAVHHDGFVPGFGQRVSRMHAAIVELDALADAVRTATKDEDLLAIAGVRLAARTVLELVPHKLE